MYKPPKFSFNKKEEKLKDNEEYFEKEEEVKNGGEVKEEEEEVKNVEEKIEAIEDTPKNEKIKEILEELKRPHKIEMTKEKSKCYFFSQKIEELATKFETNRIKYSNEIEKLKGIVEMKSLINNQLEQEIKNDHLLIEDYENIKRKY